jgi:hypothetical protein
MANPNIVSVTSIKGESVGYNLTATTTTTLLTVASEKIVKVNRITVANVDGTNAADVTISVTKANFTPDGISNLVVAQDLMLELEVAEQVVIEQTLVFLHLVVQ